MTKPSSSRRSILLLLVLVALFAGIGLWFARREGIAREEAIAPTPESAQTRAPARLAPVDTASGRSALPDSAQPDATPIPTEPVTAVAGGGRIVSGVVIDVEGVPVPSATITVDTVGFEDAPTLATSAADGTFTFATEFLTVDLIASTPKLRTLRAQSWTAERPEPGCIVVAPCTDVTGVVVQESGEPIRGASVSVEVPQSALAGITRSLAGSIEPQNWTIATGADGRFAYERAFRVPGSRMAAQHSDFLTSSVPIPEDTSLPLRITLARNPEVAREFISGVVLRQSGARAIEAQVYFGDESTKVDSNAEFKLRLPQMVVDELPLVAIEVGSQPAVVSNFGGIAREAARSSTAQRLVLGAATKSIAGRVLDAHGKPLEGARVALLDPVVISDDLTAESLASAKADVQRTGADGTFEISGLLDRDYRIQVFHAELYGRLESEAIRAGSTGVVLAFPADALVEDLSGRVQGHDGTPIAGARVFVSVVSKRVGGSSASRGFRTETTTSDGSFHFENMPRRLSVIRVMSPGVVNSETPLESLDVSRPIVITVDRICSVRLEGSPSLTEMRWMTALDSNGKELMIEVEEGSSRSGSSRLQFKGAPPQFEVSEAAVEFVLYFPYDTLLSKRPVRLLPGDVNVLKW